MFFARNTSFTGRATKCRLKLLYKVRLSPHETARKHWFAPNKIPENSLFILYQYFFSLVDGIFVYGINPQ